MAVGARLFIVRHGETDANKSGIIQGQLDTPLNEHGKKQARQVTDALRTIPFGKAYTSDLQRAADTAACILRHHPELLNSLEKTQALRERLMGDLQGKHISEFSIKGDFETTSAFISRATSWWSGIIPKLVEEAQTTEDKEPMAVLVVTHGVL
ncbi:hypothetical protein AX16_008868 [Volvariella volvacea WC 439]|nr:hypothetical protein AX16_008868 [Volvariella volvacea WC 439]